MMALLLTWLCWPWLAWRARAARATPVRRILLIQTAKIGDMLCATPVIAALRAAYPHAELTVLHDPITSRIIAQQPGLRRLAQPARAFRGLAGRRALLRLLRDGQYDTVLTLSPNLSFWLAPFWAGAARRWSIFSLTSSGGSPQVR
jgi:ADP-heptose:LPS heptosyltransferase